MPVKKFKFDALILKNESVNAGYIEFPYDVKKEFGKGRVKVKATIDGFLYRGSLVKMGGTCHWLGINQEVRKHTGKNPGDTVHIILEEDTEERTVEIPADFLQLLKQNQKTFDCFHRLSYSHKKEYVRWITDAKKEETRKTRLAKAIEMLGKNVKTPDKT